MRAGRKANIGWVLLLLALQLALASTGWPEGPARPANQMALAGISDGYVLVAGREIALRDDRKFIMFQDGRLDYAYPLIISDAAGRVNAGMYCVIENFAMLTRVIPEGRRFKILRIDQERFPNPAINRVSFVLEQDDYHVALYCSIDDGSQQTPISRAQFLYTVGPYFSIVPKP